MDVVPLLLALSVPLVLSFLRERLSSSTTWTLLVTRCAGNKFSVVLLSHLEFRFKLGG